MATTLRTNAVIFPVLLVLLLGSAHQAPRASAVGCYRLTLGSWSGTFPSGLTTEHIPPPIFQLDTARLKEPFDRSGMRRVVPEALVPQRHAFPAAWRAVGLDSIAVVWSTGFAGVTLLLRQNGDTLSGYARSFYDVVGPREPTASVLAVRIRCQERS